MVKSLPPRQETQVQSLGQEDPLKKEMAAPSRILVWEILWTEQPGGLQSMGLQSGTWLSDFYLDDLKYLEVLDLYLFSLLLTLNLYIHLLPPKHFL